ncbi:unnamed protein product [Rotaria magnacalcarata]|uniref:Uncharacterized protein n=2 Tax=Rotaria magnacalcarata TaxID=392030 RepID=A0A819EUJ9_9BILA|nr:unnamed protein product [Rotaria magnacalcarata]
MTYLPSITNELPPLTSASKTVEPSTSATYSYVTDLYIYLIRAPQKVPPTRTCKEEFVKDCRILYQDNLSVLKAIKEFDETYVPEEAIRCFNGDEGKILLFPTHTVNLFDCVYDEEERLWNAIFTRISQTDDPLLRISNDERLMRLELSLCHLIEQKDPMSDDMNEDVAECLDLDKNKFEFTKKILFNIYRRCAAPFKGDFELAWNIFDELIDQTGDMDAFLYEDILFARPDGISDIVFLENSYAFLDYCSAYDDDENELSIDERSSYIIDAWDEFGYKHFYQNQNTEKALVCYIREKELPVTSQSSSSYFNPLLGSCSERMGDVYASMNDLEKASSLFKEALNLSMEETFVINVMTTASARYEQAVNYAKQALSIVLPDPLLLERLIDDCCLLLIELHQSINGNNDKLPPNEEFLKDRISLNDEQIKTMLQMTVEDLSSKLNSE